MDESQVTEATAAPVEPTDTATSAPAEPASAPEPETAAPETTVAEEATPAPAPAPAPIQATVEEPPIRPLGASGQTPEAAVANNGPAPVGKIVVQKTIKELEDELDSGAFKSIEDFVKAHWDAQDANVQRIATVLRMEAVEVWGILKSFGIKFPQGM